MYNIDDENFDIQKSRRHEYSRKDAMEQLKALRLKDKNVLLYEKMYHSLFNTNLRFMDRNQIDDMINFIINQQLVAEREIKEEKSKIRVINSYFNVIEENIDD